MAAAAASIRHVGRTLASLWLPDTSTTVTASENTGLSNKLGFDCTWPSNIDLRNRSTASAPSRQPIISSHIKPDNRELVHDAIIKRTYLKSGAALSADEKRAIGLNPRYKFYQAQLDALTQEGLKVGSSHAFSVIELRAQSRHARIQNQIDMLKSGVVTHLEIISGSDSRDCSWCLQQDGKRYPLNVDIDKLIQDNCTCEHCRLGLVSVVENGNG